MPAEKKSVVVPPGDTSDKKKGKDVKESKDEKGKGKKEEPAKGKDAKGKDAKEEVKGKDAKGKDARGTGKVQEIPVVEPVKTPSMIALEEAEFRAMMRRQRFKRKWPEVTQVEIRTRPWYPPAPPQKMPGIMIELPPLETRPWVPPYRRRRRPRAKLLRIPAEEITKPLYECAQLNRIWHNFKTVDRNKMMIQGSIACNRNKYQSASGAQTGCIAFVCRALLSEKTPDKLDRRDVDDAIVNGEQFYKQCMVALKCYKGKPKLQLNQLLTTFFLHDTKYTIKLAEVDKGLLAKHPDNLQSQPDLMNLMEKRSGGNYMMILTVGGDRHFLIWGHPPESAGGNVKTICYLFDPHSLNDMGQPTMLRHRCKYGAGAFIRYPGVTSFVLDFLDNYADLESARKENPKPGITLTDIEVAQKEPVDRVPRYDLDMKALHIHCQSMWDTMNYNALMDQKMHEGKYPLASLSMVSLATKRARSRRRIKEFYRKLPKEPPVVLPVPVEKGPPCPTIAELMKYQGENFFLYCPRADRDAFGRDDLIPLPTSETLVHSPVEQADKNFESQFNQVDVQKWILRATRHMASARYEKFLWFTGVACCVAALAMLQRLRARGWNEDILDETLDVGFNFFRESLGERGGPLRRLTLGEHKDIIKIRETEYKHKVRGVAVWGKLLSNSAKVFDICRGLQRFFLESDSGLLQIPGAFETAIWNEGGKYYIYHPWPADEYGYRVSLQGGGKACLMYFSDIERMCEHFLEITKNMKRKPFSISEIGVYELGPRPEPVNKLKPVAPDRWVIKGSFHEGDERFPEEHRNKQATPNAIAAIAMAHLLDPATWNPEDIDEALIRGDILYENTMEHLEKMGISFETPPREEETTEEEDIIGQGPSGTLAAADVLPRFRINEYDCIETDIMDSTYTGTLSTAPCPGVMSLKEALKALFKDNKYAVMTARGGSTAIWEHDNHYYFFDPHACDENGLPSDDLDAAAVLVRMKKDVNELADVIMANLAPGADDSFNISPVEIISTKLNPFIGAPETKLESKEFKWQNVGTAAILMGPRGQNSGLGKAVLKANVPKDDLAGRVIGLPAAAAFCAATATVPPPHMHNDHMFNFLDAGADYYVNHVKNTGRRDIKVEDLTEKFEMGANTFSIELGEPTRLPLRIPDVVAEGEGGDEDEDYAEGEEVPKEKPPKQIKELLFKMWYDSTKPTTVSLLVGDYHQIGIWMAAGGKVVAFDPAPTLYKGLLTPQRIKKGDQLRLQRIKDENPGEGGDEDEDEEAEGEGEEQPEPEPEFVPPESCPVLMVAATPGELIDKLVEKGGLDRKQMLGPYWLYPVTVTNELTALLKEKRGKEKTEEEAAADEEAEELLVEPLDDSVIGDYFQKVSRGVASLRGRIHQNEKYFMDTPNRDNQDVANAVMGIVVDNIEPYITWKPQLIDAILKYGDRLHTMSLPNAAHPPKLQPDEVEKEFHVTHFDVKLEVDPNVVTGDIKAPDTGAGVANLKKGLKTFFENNKYGVLCAKRYCVGVWKVDDKTFALWDPHPTGPDGRTSPHGAAALVLFSTIDDMAEIIKQNIQNLNRSGPNQFTISAVKCMWEIAQVPPTVSPDGAVADESYEFKVLTGYVETARGRTILRGSRPCDLVKFTRDAVLQSSCGAIVAACMTHVRRPHLWTCKTVDAIMCEACKLFTASLCALGYEFRPGEDVLLPLQVLKRIVLGVNYVKYDLLSVFSGKLEQKSPADMTLKCALESFFNIHTHGILWSMPYAVAIWRVPGAPCFYMMEPHACGPTGLRIDAQDDAAACVMTFTSPKLMSYAYLQNIPTPERFRRDFILYALKATVRPIKKLPSGDIPLVRGPKGVLVVPATSKVDMFGRERRADERYRKHPPGSVTCLDAQRATDLKDKDDSKYKGRRNNSGWLALKDDTQYLSAQHSIACRKFPYASRGNQAISCAIMAGAMSRVEDVCRWCSTTLDEILESGDQLYQDSYLHYRPKETKILAIDQILRKFYTPGNCVCRVVIFQARQKGIVDEDLVAKVTEFFREEKAGVFVAGRGDFAVALFRTPRGFYMFDPQDRDRYGRAVAPPCIGRARACFSQYPTVRALCEKLGPNIPPMIKEKKKKVKKEEPEEKAEKRLSILGIRSPESLIEETLSESKVLTKEEQKKAKEAAKKAEEVAKKAEEVAKKAKKEAEKMASMEFKAMSDPSLAIDDIKDITVLMPTTKSKSSLTDIKQTKSEPRVDHRSVKAKKDLAFVEDEDDDKEVHFEDKIPFSIYGMEVTSLRRVNEHEK